MIYTTYKQDFVNPRTRGRPPKKWTDMVRQDTGLIVMKTVGEVMLRE